MFQKKLKFSYFVAVFFFVSTNHSSLFAAFDQDFFALIDLNTPGLETVKSAVAINNYDAAFDAYCNILVRRIRPIEFGEFSWHAYQTHPRPLGFADRLIGVTSQDAYHSNPNGTDYWDTRGMSGTPGTIGVVDWNTPLSAPDCKDDYSWFRCFTPLTVKYFQTQQEIYLKKWFELVNQFCVNQKTQILTLSPTDQKPFNCNWSMDAQTALNQAERVHNIIKQFAVIAKTLGRTGSIPDFKDVLKPETTKVSDTIISVIPSRELAYIVRSLIVDHPWSMFTRYENAGAVPNQRFNGLSAVSHLMLLFPEFKTIKDSLALRFDAAVADFARGNFFDDGGMIEQSFNYNTGDLSKMNGLFTAWANYNTPAGVQALQKGSQYFTLLLMCSTIPMGGDPRNGNNSMLEYPTLWEGGTTESNWKSKQHSSFLLNYDTTKHGDLVQRIANNLWGDGSVDSPAFTSFAAPHIGYMTMRKCWEMHSPWMWINIARPSRGHDSPDNSSVQIAAFGRLFLTLAGVHWYDKSHCPDEYDAEFSQYNSYFDEGSSWKANTVLCDGKSQNGGGPILEVPDEYPDCYWHTSSQFDYIDNTYTYGYGTITSARHKRRIFFSKELSLWIIHDELTDTTTDRTFTQVWNYMPTFAKNEVTVDTINNTVITSDANSPNIFMFVSSNDKLTWSKYYGHKGSQYLGWFKYGIVGAPEAKVDVHINTTGKSVHIVNLFAPSINESSTVSSYVARNDTQKTGCTFKVSGADVTYYGARSLVQSYSVGRVAVTAKNIFNITYTNGKQRGIVLGAGNSIITVNGTATQVKFDCYEYHTDSIDEITVTEIKKPDMFSWENGNDGIYPVCHTVLPMTSTYQAGASGNKEIAARKQVLAKVSCAGSILYLQGNISDEFTIALYRADGHCVAKKIGKLEHTQLKMDFRAFMISSGLYIAHVKLPRFTTVMALYHAH